MRAWLAATVVGLFSLGLGGAKAAAAEGDKPAPSPAVSLTEGRQLLPGAKCRKATMPAWSYDPAQHQVSLPGASYQVRLPADFSVRLERPDLVIVSAPQGTQGVRPVFEIFVSPICKSYDGPKALARIAARGVTDLLAPKATMAQVDGGKWSGGLGGPVGVSLILYDVALTTGQGSRVLRLYMTDLGAAKTFGIHAAAVCPSPGTPEKEGPCEETYFAMLKSTEGAK